MTAFRLGQPFAAYRTGVRAEWLDYNGHMNDSAYAIVCTEANERLLDVLGIGAEYRGATGCAMYTVEAHLRYLGEVGPGAELHAETLVVAADTKRLRVHTSILLPDDALVLTGEYLFLHVDQSAGRVAPFPPDRHAAVEAALEAHRELERPAHLGLGVGAPRPGR